MKQILHFFFWSALILPLCAQTAPAQTGTPPRVALEYYGEIGCAHCDQFVEKVLPEAEAASGILTASSGARMSLPCAGIPSGCFPC